MKDKIICLIGESGSGKDTIADLLAERLGWNKIKSYTTREPRYEGEDTHTFIRLKLKRYKQEYDEKLDRVIKVYQGIDGETYNETKFVAHAWLYGEHYFIFHNQYKNKGISIYVTSPRGAEQTKSNADCEVVTVYLQADYRERLARLDKRDKRDDIPTLSFMDRIKKDKDIFHTINQVDHVIDANDDIETVYERVERCLYAQTNNRK